MNTADRQPTTQRAPARSTPLAPKDLEAIDAAASDWLYHFCSAEGRAKLLRQHGLAVAVAH